MPGWLGFYAHEEDTYLLRQRLDEDPEIAFILQNGPGRWRAVENIDELQGKTVLWHVPGGPLPLLGRGAGEPDTLIENPFAGWQERREGLDYSVPYFGPSWPSALLLELYTPGWRGLETDRMPLSGLSYFGDQSGRTTHPTTRRWWRRMRDWMRRHAVRITRSGPLEGRHADVWAMPAALHAIQAGLERDDHPLTLFPRPRPGR
ncbi:hypothetical protein [Archangium sp.]|uniref:hypothetical protein n=1 Tax=Archangium sp. TaxID=1872627 RepID=UPI002D3C06C2|nr:hypothetical protein [Archangium sp.]HYO58066.1 hypothetical protein [Archangium sp.]